jgi:hypothetical protein
LHLGEQNSCVPPVGMNQSPHFGPWQNLIRFGVYLTRSVAIVITPPPGKP